MPGQHDNGPYESDREAHAAAVAAIPPEPGWSILSQAQHSQLLHDALTAAGVETSAFEDRTVWGLGNWEDYLCATIARWITSAYEAGKAAGPDGAVTEWGACRRGEVEPFAVGPDEAAVRRLVGDFPHVVTALVQRQITPWKEVSDAQIPE